MKRSIVESTLLLCYPCLNKLQKIDHPMRIVDEDAYNTKKVTRCYSRMHLKEMIISFVKPRNSVDGSSYSRRKADFYEDRDPRFSFDDSSRTNYSKDSIEQLRRVIKDSLCQQSLLPRSPEDDRGFLKGTMFNAKEKLMTSNMSKSSNFITRLMGLEEDFSQVVQTKKNPNPKSLDEIIDAVRSKGLLRYNSYDKKQLKTPPIVIIKPIYLPQWEISQTRKFVRKEYKEDVKHFDSAELNLPSVVYHNKQRKEVKKKTMIQKELTEDNKTHQRKERISVSQKSVSFVSPEKFNKKLAAPRISNSSLDDEVKKNSDVSIKKKRISEPKLDRKPTDNIQINKGENEKEESAMPSNGNDGTDKLDQELVKEVIVKGETVIENDLMHLLLSSRSFISHAEELFKVEAQRLARQEKKSIDENVIRNAKLYLDFGKELMTRKKKRQEQVFYRAVFSQYQLAKEACERIKALECYVEINKNASSDEVLYKRLERDLKCNDILINSGWDIGWECREFNEEVHQIARGLEKDLFTWLIEEVAVELVR